jgi:AmpE protein
MNFIALLFGIWIEQQLAHLLQPREPRWFDAYFDWGMRHLSRMSAPRALAVTALLALVPALPVAAIAWLFWGRLLGLPYLIFALVVLLFSLGPRNLTEDVEDYLRTLELPDETRRAQRAKALIEHDAPSDPLERTRVVEEAIFVQANNRMFGVILWFMLLGPTGAWLFRVTDLLRRRAVFEGARVREQSGQTPDYVRAAQRVHGALAWLPDRLLALGYALAGSFEDAVSDWRAYYQNCSEHFFEVNEAVLACAGAGALRTRAFDASATAEAAQALRGALRLVNRTLIVWLTAIALLTVVGWAV